MFLQLALLPPLGHKEAIGTLGYPIASKLEDQIAFVVSVDKQTHIGLYNIDSYFIAPAWEGSEIDQSLPTDRSKKWQTWGGGCRKLEKKCPRLYYITTLSFNNNEPSKNKHFLNLLFSLAGNSQEPKLKRIFEIP